MEKLPTEHFFDPLLELKVHFLKINKCTSSQYVYYEHLSKVLGSFFPVGNFTSWAIFWYDVGNFAGGQFSGRPANFLRPALNVGSSRDQATINNA